MSRIDTRNANDSKNWGRSRFKSFKSIFVTDPVIDKIVKVVTTITAVVVSVV